MLLLILSLFSNYYLFHCNLVREAYYNKTQLSAQMRRSIREIDTLLRHFQQEVQKQKSALRTVDLEDYLKDVGLLDYSITHLWWEGTTGVDQIGHKTPTMTFLPTPVGHRMTNPSEHKHSEHPKSLWENLNSLTGIQLNYSAGPLDAVPIPGYLPEHSDYPFDLQPYIPSTIPALPIVHPLDPYRLTFYPTKATAISIPRQASPSSVPARTATGPSPVPSPDRYSFDQDYLPGSPSTWIDPLKPVQPTRLPNDTDIFTTMPADTRPSSASETTTRVSTLSPIPLLSPRVVRGPITNNPKTSFIFNIFTMTKRMKERTDYTPDKRITKANRITPMTHQLRQIGRTLSKAQAWVRNRQWMKSFKARRHTERKTKEGLRTAEPELPPPGYEERTETAFTGELLQENAQEFLYVTVPASISKYVTSPPTAASNVLLYARNFTRPSLAAVHPNKEYHDLMDKWDEGYMMVFLLELSRLVSVKIENEFADVLQHAELIMNRFNETGELAWLGDRIMNMAMYICRFCSESVTHNKAALRTYAVMFNQMLRERDMAMSVETKSIIDYASLMYEDDEGEALFDALREFEEYRNPNVRKTSREICLNLMLTFLRPFRRLRTTDRCKRLLHSVNRALIQWFGEKRAHGEFLMLGITATTKRNYSKERNRTYSSLKQRINIKRHLTNRTKHHEDTYRRQIIQAAEHPMLRSMLPITRYRKWFRVITPRQLRSNAHLNIDRPTKEYFYRRHGRPIHPQNEMLQFFPRATKESEIKRRTQPSDGTRDKF